MTVRVGVLGLQGAVREHVSAIEAVGHTAVIVKEPEELADIDGLIIPGGESTTMRKLIDEYNFMPALHAFAQSKKPMFGTCAGLILLAKKIDGYEQPHIGVMDAVVARNSFGRQKDSFEAELDMVEVGDRFPAVFIRAPHIMEVGPDVTVLAKHDGRIVAARDGQYLGCSFHPELTEDHRMTDYFIEMVLEYKKSLA